MWLFDVVWALAIFLVVRWLAARLLAVRIGSIATLACVAFGVAAGLGLQREFTGGSKGNGSYVLFAALSVLATMMLVAILGLAAQPAKRGQLAGNGGFRRPLHGLRTFFARTARYLGILWLGARYGMGPLTGLRPVRDERELGVALCAALQDAGGIFIKFGQVLSARTDLVPAAIALELSSLQDDVAPLPVAAIREVIRRELGRDAEESFAYFDEEPLGAASIAQVHRARLESGDEVVVKVLRPGIERLVERDLDILLRLARSLEERADWARRIGSASLAQGFADNLHEELDFRIEAQNMVAVALDGGHLRTPNVFRTLSTRRVLVEEWIDGQTLRVACGPLTPEQQRLLARTLLDGVLRQVFESGVFHADPHAGNVLVDVDGRIALIDFGSVGRLDRLQQPALAQALAAIARRNPAILRDALVELATADDVIDVEGLERALARFFVHRLGPGMEPGADILNDLLGLVIRYGLSLDPQLAGVFRCLATLEGTLRLIDPTFNLVDEAKRFADENKLGLPQPERLKEELLEDVLGLLPALRKIPRRLDHITGALERGELTVRIRPLAHQHDVELFARMTSRMMLAFFSASIGLVSVFLLNVKGGPILYDTHLDVLLGYGGLIAATVLGLRVIGCRHSRRRLSRHRRRSACTGLSCRGTNFRVARYLVLA